MHIDTGCQNRSVNTEEKALKEIVKGITYYTVSIHLYIYIYVLGDTPP